MPITLARREIFSSFTATGPVGALTLVEVIGERADCSLKVEDDRGMSGPLTPVLSSDDRLPLGAWYQHK